MPVQRKPEIERRRYPRRDWRADLQGICVDPEGRRAVERFQAVDISKGGLGVIGERDHSIGQHFVVCLPSPTGGSRCVHAKVVRCWEDKFGAHLGMKFTDVPDEVACSRLAA